MCKLDRVTSGLSYRVDQDGDGVARRQLSQPRIAEMIADSLRRRILAGELIDGDVLPEPLREPVRLDRPRTGSIGGTR